MATTWPISPSRKRRSNPQQWHHWRVQEEVRRCFAMVTWRDWILSLAKGGGAKKRFQNCVNPNSSNQFLCFRAIQGHSGENYVDPLLQDKILLPDDFTEYVCPVGNAGELNSIIRNGLIQGGKSLKRGRHAVFVTTANPMKDGKRVGETPCDLTKPRIAPYKNTWKSFQNTVFWWQFEARSRERSAILPNAVTCSRSLQHTICSFHWESGMYENSGWALPEGSLNSKSTTCRTKIELAIWSTRSTTPRRKIILGTIKRLEKLRWNL